jgi:hypothetical protein
MWYHAAVEGGGGADGGKVEQADGRGTEEGGAYCAGMPMLATTFLLHRQTDTDRVSG